MRGWRGNALGLQRWEVECIHKARLDATEAIAHLMRRGKSFAEAKAEVVARAKAIYKSGRPEMIEGYNRVFDSIQLSDMPSDVFGRSLDRRLADIEQKRGKKAGRFERWLYHTFGVLL